MMSTTAAPVTGRIFIAGGTGFVGSQVRSALAGRPLRLLARDRVAHAALAGGDVEVAAGDVAKPATLRGVMQGCQAAINLAAVIEERGDTTFDAVIRQGTINLLAEAERAGVTRFLQMSAMGARADPCYPYLEAKWQAEQAVEGSSLAWTIFRPSVIFGPGDGFINALAGVVRHFPVVPVVATGETKFQPVAVADVAAAFARASDDPQTAYRVYELGGPEVLTYEQMLDLIAAQLGRHRPKVHLPVALVRPIVKLAKPLPRALRPPVTEEQLKMLSLDNCSDHSATEELVGRAPARLADGIGYVAGSKG